MWPNVMQGKEYNIACGEFLTTMFNLSLIMGKQSDRSSLQCIRQDTWNLQNVNIIY